MKNFIQKAYNFFVTKNKPTSLIHFITNQCNARCPHCFIDFNNKNSQNEKISLENISKLTKTTGKQLMNVNITGGEPFLDENIEKICYLYLQNTSINSMLISTNGYFTEKICKLAKKMSEDYPNVIFTYSISIDHIKNKHDSYRKVKDLYKNALLTYKKIADMKNNVQANITITVTDYNSRDIVTIFNTLYFKENINSIIANMVRDEGAYTMNNLKKNEINSAYKKLTDLIIKNNTLYINNSILSRMINEKEKILYRYFQNIFLNQTYHIPCYAGGGLLGIIYPNGDIYPCEILNIKMGNLYNCDFNLLALWEENKELRKLIKKKKCNCTYECAWTYNILSSPKHIANLTLKGLNIGR